MNDKHITIVTHNGIHHEDDVLACAILTTIFKDHEIIRTRDSKIIESADFAIDVGGIYDHSSRRYDHHMSNPPCDEKGHMLSSAGLIWRHYCEDYFDAIKIPREIEHKNCTLNLRDSVEDSIYNRWIYPVDMVDNGQFPGPTIISEIVNSTRPIWLEKTRDKCDKQFVKAVELIRDLLERACFHSVDKLLSKTEFLMAKKKWYRVGKIMVSDVPVRQTTNDQFYTGEHFHIYPSREYIDEEEVTFIVKPIKNKAGLYVTRIPDKLLGLRDEEIYDITNISGILYIHHTGFMVRAKDEHSAVSFCKWVLDNSEN